MTAPPDELANKNPASGQARSENNRDSGQVSANDDRQPVDSSQAEISVPDEIAERDYFPPGLVGEVCGFIYDSAPRPVPEVALAAGLALFASIAGRHWTISGTGLNLYLIVLAPTGSGKEGAQQGINRLRSALRPHLPGIIETAGPGHIASGQALIKYMGKHPCCLSVLGEFAITMKDLSDPRAPSHMRMLRKVLLDLYNKSGPYDMLHASAYADGERNTAVVDSPAFSILAESVPETFYDEIGVEHVASGLIPRFSILEYEGPRPKRNPNAHGRPPDELVAALRQVAEEGMRHGHIQVEMDTAARLCLDAFDRECDRRIDEAGSSEVLLQIWNRAHLKALRLAALIAVGIDHKRPVISLAVAGWAKDFVAGEVLDLAERFTKGQIGTGASRQDADIAKAVNDWLDMPAEKRERSYACPKRLQKGRYIPFEYFRRRLQGLSSFKNRPDTRAAIRSALEDAIKAGVLSRVSPTEALHDLGTSGDVFICGPMFKRVLRASG